MSDEKLLKIAEKLLERTRAGEIPWSETASPDNFAAPFPEYAVTVQEYSGRIYRFSVHNEKGTVVESTSLKGVDTILGRLYESARSRVLKSDEILDALLNRLSGDG